ncbi:hypothetical protein B0H34DRAFT_80479 [Crassisporium funariophilum]|nr:hypothetical protein B0H34DRAFT_80479 [Crassisporium funariophilum]
MAGSRLSVIVDDKRSEFIQYGPLQWTTSSLASMFNGTAQSPVFALNNTGQFGTLFMNFSGTSVAFFGTTPPIISQSQLLTVSIDGNLPYNTSYADPNPPTYRQWYQSPTLQEGTHNITLSHIAGTAFDYAEVIVGNDTPLGGQSAIVDNDDSAITYNGRWRRNQDFFNSGTHADGFPYHNSTHQTTDTGDAFTFRFAGKSAAIYGIFTWSNIGVISLTFTLDGASLSQSYRVETDTPQFISEEGQQPNFLFYSYDFLPEGNHTLVVNVTNCVNQTFIFDYITYTPSFSTLGAMPNLTSTLPDRSGNSSRKTSVGTIVGGIVGGIVVFLLVAGIFWTWRRRLRRNGDAIYKPLDPFVPQRREAAAFLLHPHFTPPATASTFHSTFGSQQIASSSQYVVPAENTRFSAAGEPSTGQNLAAETLYDGPDTSRPTAATTSFHNDAREDDAWEGGDTGPSPPSYDETLRSAPVRLVPVYPQ